MNWHCSVIGVWKLIVCVLSCTLILTACHVSKTNSNESAADNAACGNSKPSNFSSENSVQDPSESDLDSEIDRIVLARRNEIVEEIKGLDEVFEKHVKDDPRVSPEAYEFMMKENDEIKKELRRRHEFWSADAERYRIELRRLLKDNWNSSRLERYKMVVGYVERGEGAD